MEKRISMVSVIMPAYNAELFIGRAVDSLLSQTYPNWEIIIINDGSTDRTTEIVAKYHDSRIKLYHQSNQGEAAARNTALSKVMGNFIAFLDADDLFLPWHLEITIDYLLKHPEHDAVYTDGYHINPEGKYLQILSTRRRGPFVGRIFEEVVRASDVFGPPGVIVMRSNLVLERELRFDQEIVIGDDWDFFIRYSDLASFGYIDRQTYLYRIHGENISISTNRHKRNASLALCRKKSIEMPSFNNCSIETRSAVFYDLLINLLNEYPDQQSEVIRMPQFLAIPSSRQAHLLRLMASEAVFTKKNGPHIRAWLKQSRNINPNSYVSFTLYWLHLLCPKMVEYLIRIRRLNRTHESELTRLRNMS